MRASCAEKARNHTACRGLRLADLSFVLQVAEYGKLRLQLMAILSKVAQIAETGVAMKTMSAKDAKNGFGRLIDAAIAEPVTIEKHGRGVVVVMSVEEYERLRAQRAPTSAQVRNIARRG